MNNVIALLSILLSVQPILANDAELLAEPVPVKIDHHIFAWSVAAMSTSVILDDASNWHRTELNSVVDTRGKFGGEGVLIKAGILAAFVGVEIACRKHQRSRGPSTKANFIAAGALTGVAVRNWSIR